MVCQLQNVDVNSTRGAFYHWQAARACSCHDASRVLPVENGLSKFREWWAKVQTGRDIAEDNKTMFRRRLVGLIVF